MARRAPANRIYPGFHNMKNDVEVIRKVNTAMVLDILRRADGELSRPLMAETLGLSKVTVSTIVRSLSAKGLIAEVGMGGTDSRGGRRPVLVALDKERKRVLGARLGHSSIDLILSDITGRELKRLRTAPKNQDRRYLLAAMVNEIMMSTNTPRDAVLGLVGTLGGAEAPPTCRIGGPESEPLPTEADLARSLGFPAMLINHTRARAFAECWFNPDQEDQANFFFINLGHRLDGVAARRGQLDEAPCELGACYLSALAYGDTDGELKTLDSVLGGRSLLSRAAAVFNRELDGRELEKIAAAGDERALELYRIFGYNLGCALSLVVNMACLRKIVIGGQVSRAWKYFEPTMRQGLERHTILTDARRPVEVRLIRPELDSGLMGSLALALDHWVFHTDMLRGS